MIAVFSLLFHRWYFFDLEITADSAHIILHYEHITVDNIKCEKCDSHILHECIYSH